jgi:hypothetical protein
LEAIVELVHSQVLGIPGAPLIDRPVQRHEVLPAGPFFRGAKGGSVVLRTCRLHTLSDAMADSILLRRPHTTEPPNFDCSCLDGTDGLCIVLRNSGLTFSNTLVRLHRGKADSARDRMRKVLSLGPRMATWTASSHW